MSETPAAPGTGGAAVIAAGRASLGIELGSTRIKACLISDDASTILAEGSHTWENRLEGGLWTYGLDQARDGVRAAYGALAADAERRHGIRPSSLAGIGISAMMHGYLAFDADGELVTPFRTWRNTNTETAARELTELLGVNIPLRWSIAHLHQAILDGEEHVPRVRHLTTLAGWIHEQLTDERVLGVGDASGMFPIDSATHTWDATRVAAYDAHTAGRLPADSIVDLLPRVLVAGEPAGTLTEQGAALLDPTGTLRPGIPLCPPEGDAGTGMVATDSVAPRTGNVSAGTSIFAMIVLERPLEEPFAEIDVVTTPAGAPVAMVHCNNGASELAAWAALFGRFAELLGTPVASDRVFETLLTEALTADADAGGLLAYNQLAGEPLVGLPAGRPLFVRTPESRLTLANTMRAHVYGVFAALATGMEILDAAGVRVDRLQAHGGLFRTGQVAQRLLAAALRTPVSVAHSAAEGGAWGMAVLAGYLRHAQGIDLQTYLHDHVFRSTPLHSASPDAEDVAGFARYLDRYRRGLAVETAAVHAL